MAKTKLGIKVKGIDLCQASLKRMPKSLTRQMVDKQYEITKFLANRARLNAPIKTGALRRTLLATHPVVKGTAVVNEIQSPMPYALKLHEHPFRLGPRSAQQPPTPEGGVGHKYISRCIDFWNGWIKHEWTKFVVNFKP